MLTKTIDFIISFCLSLITPTICVWITIDTYIIWAIDKQNPKLVFGLCLGIVVSCLMIFDSCLDYQEMKKKVKQK